MPWTAKRGKYIHMDGCGAGPDEICSCEPPYPMSKSGHPFGQAVPKRLTDLSPAEVREMLGLDGDWIMTQPIHEGAELGAMTFIKHRSDPPEGPIEFNIERMEINDMPEDDKLAQSYEDRRDEIAADLGIHEDPDTDEPDDELAKEQRFWSAEAQAERIAEHERQLEAERASLWSDAITGLHGHTAPEDDEVAAALADQLMSLFGLFGVPGDQLGDQEPQAYAIPDREKHTIKKMSGRMINGWILYFVLRKLGGPRWGSYAVMRMYWEVIQIGDHVSELDKAEAWAAIAKWIKEG